MNLRSKYFEAGVLAGRLESVKHVGEEKDPRFATLEDELRRALHGLSSSLNSSLPLSELVSELRKISDRESYCCFEVGKYVLLLQLHLQIFSLLAVQSDSNAPPPEAIAALKPLLQGLRLMVAEIGASEVVDAFLHRVSKALSNEKQFLAESADLFEESEVLVIRIRSQLNSSSSESKQLAADSSQAQSGRTCPKVFVVHGHNHGIKESVARFLERLGLKPIILHEQPNAGRTVIEKFSDYTDVQFAVVLLTADDLGKPRNSNQEAQLRARQNVILELGYFLGKLGRTRVCVLYEDGVELPSDYTGVLYLLLDSNERWRFDLVREIRTAGFPVDANRVFS